MRPQFFVVAVAVVLLAAACGGSSDDEALRAQVAALQAQVDAAENRSGVPRPTSTPTPQTRTATPPASPSCSIATASQTVIASTVKVVTQGGTGTAFYMGNSEFITAAHVVEGYSSVRLEARGVSLVAQVVGLSSSADVAILRASTSLRPLQWGSSSTLRQGQFVGVAGYPKGFGTSAAVSSGLVSRLFIMSGQRVIQTDAAANPGNSGGPAFDECGRVIGMVTSEFRDTEGIAFAVASSSVRSALPDVRAHPLVECGTVKLNVEAGQGNSWGFSAPFGEHTLSGGFAVEPRASGDLLDIRARVVDQFDQTVGDERKTSGGTFTLSAEAPRIAFDNNYSLFTSKNITIDWCEYG